MAALVIRPVEDSKVNPQQEYVASAGLSYFQTAPRSLSWAIDDLTADFGDDLYERMLRDPQVTACVNVFRASILEDGVHVLCALEDADADGYELAHELTAYTERTLDDLETPLDDVLWDMLAAVAFGSRVAEEVYDLGRTYTGRQQLTLRALKVKPRRATAFVVDPYLNVLGILGLMPDKPMALAAGSLLGGLGQENLLPRSKFAVATFRPVNGDPRGTSILRPAYNAWWLKMQAWQEYLKYLAQFASPSLIGFTAPNAQSYTDAAGTLVTPETAMVNALVAFRNASALAFPHGSQVQPIVMTGEGEPFLAAITLFDQQITKAILHQTLATEEGQHQARAASEVHQDVLDTMVRQAKKAIERMLRRDVLRQMVRVNYGEAALALTPKVTLGETERQDVTRLMDAIARLQTSGYLAPSQYPTIDVMLGLAQREAAEVEAARAVLQPSPAVEQEPEPGDFYEEVETAGPETASS